MITWFQIGLHTPNNFVKKLCGVFPDYYAYNNWYDGFVARQDVYIVDRI